MPVERLGMGRTLGSMSSGQLVVFDVYRITPKLSSWGGRGGRIRCCHGGSCAAARVAYLATAR